MVPPGSGPSRVCHRPNGEKWGNGQGEGGFSGGRSLFSSAFLPAHRRPASGRRGPPDGRAPGVASPCAVHPGDEAAVAGAGR